MDRQSVYSVSVFQSGAGAGDDTRLQIQESLVTFILQFRHDNSFIYRDQLRENALLKKYYCDVNITDLITYNEELAHRLVTEPAEIIPLVCSLYMITLYDHSICSLYLLSCPFARIYPINHFLYSSNQPSRNALTALSSPTTPRPSYPNINSSSILTPKMSLSET